MFRYIKEQIAVIKERDPSIRRTSEVFLYPSFYAVLYYRVAHFFYTKKWFFFARYLSQRARRKTGIEIHPGAIIGKRLFIDHGQGVVIGETCEIGDDVTLFQGVTLGGTGKELGKRHPTIGDNVMISAGAKILGSFVVGNDSKIGAGAVVLNPVPPYSTVVGIPGRVVKSKDEQHHPKEVLDQVHLPDPIHKEICRLKIRMAFFEKRQEPIPGEELERLYEEYCQTCGENSKSFELAIE